MFYTCSNRIYKLEEGGVMKSKNEAVLGLLLPVVIAFGTGLAIAFHNFISIITVGFIAWAVFLLCVYMVIMQYGSQRLKRIR